MHWTLADHGFWEIQDHCKQYYLDKLSAFFEGTLKGGSPSVSLPTNPTKATEPHQRNMVDPRPRSSGRLLPCLHIAQSREAICTGRGLAASNKPPSGLSCLGAFGVGFTPQEPRRYISGSTICGTLLDLQGSWHVCGKMTPSVAPKWTIHNDYFVDFNLVPLASWKTLQALNKLGGGSCVSLETAPSAGIDWPTK